MAFATKQTGLSRHTGYFYNNKEIVLSGQQGRVAKRPGHRGDWYPDDKKIEAATLFAVTKSVTQVSKLSGIKESLIRRWRTEPWFLNIVNQVVYEKNELLDSKITDILEKCTELIWDRLTNGDVRVNWKTGEEYVIPLDARGLALVYGIMFDKRQLLRGEATSRHEVTNSDHRLAALKAEFEKFSQATTINPQPEGLIQDADAEDTATQENETRPEPEVLTVAEPDKPAVEC